MPYDPALADRIRVILERRCEFEEKKMFGGVAFLVNTRMCCGVVKSDLMLRLGEEGAKAALEEPHTRPMDFTGKPMKSMVYVEEAGIASGRDLERWLLLAVAFAQSEASNPRPAVSRLRLARTRKLSAGG